MPRNNAMETLRGQTVVDAVARTMEGPWTYESWGRETENRGSFSAIGADQGAKSTMTRADLVFLNRDKGESTALTGEESRRKLTALSARVAVWGVITGLGSIALGAAMPLAAINLAAAGFFAGGVGAMATSVLVAKDLGKASWPLKLAAIVGLPFGASLVAFVCGGIWSLPLPVSLISLSVPVGAILGVALMILLLTGFLSHAISGSRSEWDD